MKRWPMAVLAVAGLAWGADRHPTPPVHPEARPELNMPDESDIHPTPSVYSGATACYSFNDSGNLTVDNCGNYTLTASNDPASGESVSAAGGLAATFDGVNQQFSTSGLMIPKGDFSMCFWFKNEDLSTLYYAVSQAGGHTGFLWYISATAGTPSFFVRGAAADNYAYGYGGLGGASAWTHVCGTWNDALGDVGDDNAINLYTDARKTTTHVADYPFNPEVSLPTTIGGGLGTFFEGRIDMVTFWIGYELTQDDVDFLYNGGRGVFKPQN